MKKSTVARNLVLGVLLGLFVASTADASGTIQADKVLVVKNEKLLLLLRGGKILKSYRVAIGRKPGRRMRQGTTGLPREAM